MIERIRHLKNFTADNTDFQKAFVGCLILTYDNKLLLQQRDKDAVTFPGIIATFGGKIEPVEEPIQALCRELNEELGAIVPTSEPTFIGAITESYTNHKEIVYEYFWHDKENTITGFYEGQGAYFEVASEILQHENVMEDVKWLAVECLKLNLIQ